MPLQPTYHYDQEVDVLYISFAPRPGGTRKATAAVELNDNLLLRFNRAEQRAIGLTLMDFSVLVQPGAAGPRQFPLTGLSELEPAWQEVVIAMLKQPPVNQILKLSTYTPSLSATMPIVAVENFLVPA